MHNLVRYLLTLFKATFVDDPDGRVLASVLVMDDIRADQELRAQHLPALIVYPRQSGHPPGPMAHTARTTNQIGIRGICRSVSTEAYLVPPVSGTPSNIPVTELLDRVRALLYTDKLQGGQAFTLEPTFDVRFGVWRPEKGSYFPTFDLTLTYSILEKYTGPVNNQTNLELPDSGGPDFWEN